MNDENSKFVARIFSAEDEQALAEALGKLAAFSSGTSEQCPSCGEVIAGVTLYEKIEPELFSLYVEPCGHRLGMWSGAPEWVKEAGLPITIIPLQNDADEWIVPDDECWYCKGTRLMDDGISTCPHCELL